MTLRRYFEVLHSDVQIEKSQGPAKQKHSSSSAAAHPCAALGHPKHTSASAGDGFPSALQCKAVLELEGTADCGVTQFTLAEQLPQGEPSALVLIYSITHSPIQMALTLRGQCCLQTSARSSFTKNGGTGHLLPSSTDAMAGTAKPPPAI